MQKMVHKFQAVQEKNVKKKHRFFSVWNNYRKHIITDEMTFFDVTGSLAQLIRDINTDRDKITVDVTIWVLT